MRWTLLPRAKSHARALDRSSDYANPAIFIYESAHVRTRIRTRHVNFPRRRKLRRSAEERAECPMSLKHGDMEKPINRALRPRRD